MSTSKWIKQIKKKKTKTNKQTNKQTKNKKQILKAPMIHWNEHAVNETSSETTYSLNFCDDLWPLTWPYPISVNVILQFWSFCLYHHLTENDCCGFLWFGCEIDLFVFQVVWNFSSLKFDIGLFNVLFFTFLVAGKTCASLPHLKWHTVGFFFSISDNTCSKKSLLSSLKVIEGVQKFFVVWCHTHFSCILETKLLF